MLQKLQSGISGRRSRACLRHNLAWGLYTKRTKAALYRSAADQGNAQAQYPFAALSLGGESIALNRELGIAWLRLSARQHFGRALQRLNMMDVPVEGSVKILATVSALNLERVERRQILIEDNQFEVPLAALEEEESASNAAADETLAGSDFTVLLATFDHQEAAQAA